MHCGVGTAPAREARPAWLQSEADRLNAGPALTGALAIKLGVRGFTSDAVPPDVIRHILVLSSQTPSMSNIEPWRVHASPCSTTRASRPRHERPAEHCGAM